jgi:hypothetical protein
MDTLEVQTLGGGKPITTGPDYRRWEPIKDFSRDATLVGLDRLVDAMSSFGTDRVADFSHSLADEISRVALEQLSASEGIRSSYARSHDYRAAIE